MDATFTKFVHHNSFVHRLKQTWAECHVDMKRDIHNDLCNFILAHA